MIREMRVNHSPLDRGIVLGRSVSLSSLFVSLMLTIAASSLAYAELRMTMCRLLWNFDLELPEDSRNWLKEQKTFNLWEKNPLHIRLKTIVR